MADKLDNIKYLRDLAERLMHVPVTYGTDQDDIDRLLRMAQEISRFDPPRDKAQDWWEP